MLKFQMNEYADSIKEITNSELLVNEMQKEVDKYTKLLNLAKADRLKTIKENVDYFHYNFCLPKAREWHRMINDNNAKIDKRRRYEEKDMYDYLVKQLKDDFFGDRDIDIVTIMTCGYESYSTGIVVKCNDFTFGIHIPNIKSLYMGNIEFADYGMISLSLKESEHCWLQLGKSYREEDIKKIIDESLTNK